MQLPNEPIPRRRRAFLPPMSTDFRLTIGGRRILWLERLLGAVIAPIWEWRVRRALRRER